VTKAFCAILVPLLIAGCGQQKDSSNPPPKKIQVRGREQDQLHTLDAINLAIALKRAMFAAGYRCKQITDAGFVGTYENLDMWTAHCSEGRDWAIFAGADGSAQVRDCRDIPGTGLPECKITKRPAGSFDSVG